MYVEKLELINVRCFESACLTPRHPDSKSSKDVDYNNVNLLLGNNGTGKSSTLRSLAIGVLSRVLSVSEYQPENVVRKSAKSGEATVSVTVRLGALDRPPNNHRKNKPLVLSTSIKREGDYERLGEQKGPYLPDLFVDLTPTFFLVGYGATRRVESQGKGSVQERKTSGQRFSRVSSLFYDFVALTPLPTWLPHLRRQEPKRFREIVDLINQLLPQEIRFTGEQEKKKSNQRVETSSTGLTSDYMFTFDKEPLPFGALSDGYRAYIAWIADLIFHLCQCTPKKKKMKDISGLVLVDEIDLHLHPAWQREVMSTISAAFPMLQFVCTSHSPIVAGTLKRDQVFVMNRTEEGSVEITQIDDRLHGLNADQILTSPYFGLTTTRAPGFIDELHSLRRKAWDGDQKATLEYLQRMTPVGKLGPTPKKSQLKNRARATKVIKSRRKTK